MKGCDDCERLGRERDAARLALYQRKDVRLLHIQHKMLSQWARLLREADSYEAKERPERAREIRGKVIQAIEEMASILRSKVPN